MRIVLSRLAIAASVTLFIAATLVAPRASAQAPFPSKPVRIVITFPPGGGIDQMGRMLAQKMSESFGQSVLVDNRPGGNTVIGAEHVARSPADGHTLLLAIDFTMTMNPATQERLPYDPLKDFAPVSQLGANKIGIFGNPAKLAGMGLREVMAQAKANPGKLNFGSAGLVTRMIGEQLQSVTGTKLTYVPYKGSNAVLPAVASGEIELAIDGITTYLPFMKEGKVRMLAIAGPQRAEQAPDVATLRELGFPQAEMNSWLGLFAPAGTPRPVITRLNAEVVKAWSDRDVHQRLVASGQDPVSSTPEQLGELVRSGLAQWTPIIRQLGIRTD